MNRRLQESNQATVLTNGTAQVLLGPVPVGYVWEVEQLNVLVRNPAGQLGSGIVQVFHGPTPAAPVLMDATNVGGRNRTSPPGWKMFPGEYICTTLAQSQAGQTFTVQILGTQVDYR